MKTLAPTLSLPKTSSVATAKATSGCATPAAGAASPIRRFSNGSARGQDDLDVLLGLTTDANATATTSGRRAPVASAALKPPRHPNTTCASTAEFMAPLSTATKEEIPESVQGYLQLLAESSNSNGSMQRHLVHLLARAAADTSKLTQMVMDPLDGVTDVVADHSSAVLMQHLHKNGQAGRMSMDGGAGDLPIAPPAPVKNAIQGKALSMLLSVLMSGLASSAAAEATQLTNALNLGTTATEVTKTVSHASHTSHASISDDLSFFRADSFCANQKGGASFLVRAAPSLTAGISASGASSLLGAGGMATSTALKMLRADSKMRDPDMANILGHILDTVSESTHSMDLHEMDYPTVQRAAAGGAQQCGRMAANGASAAFREAGNAA